MARKRKTIEQVAYAMGYGYQKIVGGTNPVCEHYTSDGVLESRCVLHGEERTRFKAVHGEHIMRKRRRAGLSASMGLYWLREYLDARWAIAAGDCPEDPRRIKRAKRWLSKARKGMGPKMRAKVETRWPV